LDIAAGGGGPSSLYSKPAWQTGAGVPSDGHRDIPDVSMFAAVFAVATSDGQVAPGSMSFYIVCEKDFTNTGSCDLNSPYNQFIGLAGTSASAPSFAGIMALVNQKTGERQGNANYVLYKLASQPGIRCTSDSPAVTKPSCTFRRTAHAGLGGELVENVVGISLPGMRCTSDSTAVTKPSCTFYDITT